MPKTMSTDEFMDRLEKALKPGSEEKEKLVQSVSETAIKFKDVLSSVTSSGDDQGDQGDQGVEEDEEDGDLGFITSCDGDRDIDGRRAGGGLSREKLEAEFDDPIKNKSLQIQASLPLSAEAAEPTNGAGAGEEELGGEEERVAMQKLIAQVQTKHRQLMYRIIAGESEEMICREMGIAQNKFKILTNSPLFKTELSDLRKKLQERLLDKNQLSVQDRLLTLNSTALKTLVRILTGKSGSIQLKRQVAKDIIDYNLKLAESQNKTSISETAGFIMEAFGRAEKRKSKLERPAHLDMHKDSPFSAPPPSDTSDASDEKSAVNE